MNQFKMKETLLIAAIFCLGLLAIGEIDVQQHTITTQQKTIDSLQTELFIKSTDLGRYEIAVELLGQQDTSAANKFLDIYNNETE